MDYQIYFDKARWRVQVGDKYRIGTALHHQVTHPHEQALYMLVDAIIEIVDLVQQANREASEFTVELFTADAELAGLIRSGGEPKYWRTLNLTRSMLRMFKKWKVHTKATGRKLSAT